MVTVLFQTESHYPVSRQKVMSAVEKSLSGRVRRATEVSVSIIGDRRMRQLNRMYRNIDDTTDVLSFALNESPQGSAPFVPPPDNILRLGDILVSYPQAVQEASEKNILVDDSIVFLVLHGLDHLLGIHHPE